MCIRIPVVAPSVTYYPPCDCYPIHIYIYIYTYIERERERCYVSIHLYCVCMYVYIYIYIYIHILFVILCFLCFLPPREPIPGFLPSGYSSLSCVFLCCLPPGEILKSGVGITCWVPIGGTRKRPGSLRRFSPGRRFLVLRWLSYGQFSN